MALVFTGRQQPGDPFGIVGTIIDGRYRIEAVAGAGGFGVVYRAFHLGFDSPIAVKVLRLPEHWSNEKKARRSRAFHREGKVLFNLCHLHPSFVRAFETGTVPLLDGGVAPYLALEWLNGASLAEESRARRVQNLDPLPLPDVLHLLSFPAAALARAHDKGVIHRDIKPGNLFAALHEGELLVKVLDFGIAKLVAEDENDGAEACTPSDCEVTPAATSAFTPRYAAPEQWQRRIGVTGKWTDVHALALVCVELLTGKPPLAGDDPLDCKHACLDSRSRPTPAKLGMFLGVEVESVFERALAFDPRDRFPDAGAFWGALTAAARWSFDGSRAVALASFDEARSRRERASGVGRSAGGPSGVSNTLAEGAHRLVTALTHATARSVSARPLPIRDRQRGWKVVGAVGVAAAGSFALFGPGMRVGSLRQHSSVPGVVLATSASSLHATGSAAASPLPFSLARTAEPAPGLESEAPFRPAPSWPGDQSSASARRAALPADAIVSRAPPTAATSGGAPVDAPRAKTRGSRVRRAPVPAAGARSTAPLLTDGERAQLEPSRQQPEPLEDLQRQPPVAPAAEVQGPVARPVQTLDALLRNEQLFHRR